MPDELPPRLVGDVYRFNASMNELDLAEAERRYDELLSRKARVQERFATGAILLNATSLTATFSAVQSGQAALDKLGITLPTASGALGLFVFGILSSAAAHWWESLRIPGWASQQYARLTLLRRQKSTMQSNLDARTSDLVGTNLGEIEKNPPQDFRYSKLHLWLVNVSGSMWLVGIITLAWPLWRQQLEHSFLSVWL